MNASLREVTEKSIASLINRKLLNTSSIKREVIIDCIDSDNAINDNSCKSRSTIQDVFIVTGKISKSLDVKGINSCTDLCAMINYTKNNYMLNNV